MSRLLGLLREICFCSLGRAELYKYHINIGWWITHHQPGFCITNKSNTNDDSNSIQPFSLWGLAMVQLTVYCSVYSNACHARANGHQSGWLPPPGRSQSSGIIPNLSRAHEASLALHLLLSGWPKRMTTKPEVIRAGMWMVPALLVTLDSEWELEDTVAVGPILD